MTIKDKFTTNLKKVLEGAYKLAKNSHDPQIKVEHLLAALLAQKGSIGADVLGRLKIKTEDLKALIIPQKNSKNEIINHSLKITPEFSPLTKKILEKAVLAANLYQHKYVGTEHLLCGFWEVLAKNPTLLLAIFNPTKNNLKNFEREIDAVLKSTSKFPTFMEFFTPLKEDNPDAFFPPDQKVKVLDIFTTDLTDKKIQKNIDPVIAREEEIIRLVQILSRRTKNNPILLGAPGVGKTAIVEGLAKKILLEEVPEILLAKKILALDLGLLVSGTMFRGEFENRLKQIIEEIKHDPNIILFIDELHTVVGAGAAGGSLDAANILKPYLARGQLRCIGATTFEEYKKHIEKDPALERRFQPLVIEEPTQEKTLQILKGIKENYEKYHEISITPEAIEAAVYLSHRYLPEKYLPDKAIDLIDEAAASLKIQLKTNKQLKEIKKLEENLKILKDTKQKAVIEEEFQKAINCNLEEKKLLNQLKLLKEKQNEKKEKYLGKITKKNISQVISRMTGIPLEELILKEKEKLINLETILSEKIIGQEEVIKTIANFIRRAKAGLAALERPLASFIFAGPTGVGKTELAKIIAQTVFEDEKALIRLDMSEFSERFNISRLIGAPAGYVGYEEGGKLTEALKHRPYAVILFDEIEKANPEIFNILLQILDEGHLTDAQGKKINFKNTIIIMTSNLGGKNILTSSRIGFGKKETKEESFENIKNEINKEIKNYFSPEFLNRLDKILIFKSLNLENIKQIVKLELLKLNQELRKQKIELSYNEEIIKFLANKSYDPNQGARVIRKFIQELIENPLAEKIIKNDLGANKIILKINNQKITLTS